MSSLCDRGQVLWGSAANAGSFKGIPAVSHVICPGIAADLC